MESPGKQIEISKADKPKAKVGFVDSIKDRTKENGDFRRVLYTGKPLQLVLMTIGPGEEIGAEAHDSGDQFFRIEKGKGEVSIDGHRTKIRSGDGVLVPSGARHNIVNTGDKQLRLYSLYGPPQHRIGTVQAAKAEVHEEHFDGKTDE